MMEGLDIALSDLEVEHVTLKSDHFWPVVQSVIGDVPTVLDIRSMC
jgi:hypothetical protein